MSLNSPIRSYKVRSSMRTLYYHRRVRRRLGGLKALSESWTLPSSRIASLVVSLGREINSLSVYMLMSFSRWSELKIGRRVRQWAVGHQHLSSNSIKAQCIQARCHRERFLSTPNTNPQWDRLHQMTSFALRWKSLGQRLLRCPTEMLH